MPSVLSWLNQEGRIYVVSGWSECVVGGNGENIIIANRRYSQRPPTCINLHSGNAGTIPPIGNHMPFELAQYLYKIH